ncbi:MAG: LTA synthase family protein [Lachnospiraceae bacterium]|nr:LTA synthase family protein [Lachnospiraceae bacterium]
MVLSAACFAGMLIFIVWDLQVKTKLPDTVVYEILGIGQSGDDFFEEEYVDAGQLELRFPDKKRNLIYIFLESAEITFADEENGGAFEQSCIPNLTRIAEANEDFSGSENSLNGAFSLAGTDWTMGAMFAQSSGMPLKLPLRADFEAGAAMFPELTTLGDILEKEGYQRTLLLGSNAEFGGREGYYLGHGNYEIHDYDWAIETGRLPEGYDVWWGYEDEVLFDFAKSDLATMQEPFCYTLLTADTHFDDGYYCRLCRDEFEGNQYANVYACMDRQVTEFLEWLKEQPFYDNTTIVVCGDHPTMDADFCNHVSSDYLRRTYCTIINSAVTPSDPGKKRIYSTIDLFPTTLAAMGIQIPGNKLGVGVNLYSDEQTILERYGIEEAKTIFEKPSTFMVTLSGEDNEDIINGMDITGSWLINEEEGTLTIFVSGFVGLDPSYIENFYAEVTDSRTGETMTVSLIIPDNPNPWFAWAKPGYSPEESDYLTVVAYIKLYDKELKEVCRITP